MLADAEPVHKHDPDAESESDADGVDVVDCLADSQYDWVAVSVDHPNWLHHSDADADRLADAHLVPIADAVSKPDCVPNRVAVAVTNSQPIYDVDSVSIADGIWHRDA
jgi:hypothetical protein